MKSLKYIAQIIVAIIYSSIIAGLFYYVFVTLSTWEYLQELKAEGFVMTILLTVIFFILLLSLYPYSWITKSNIVATILSIAILLSFFVWTGINIWKAMIKIDHKLFAFIYTGYIIMLLIMLIGGILSFYRKD